MKKEIAIMIVTVLIMSFSSGARLFRTIGKSVQQTEENDVEILVFNHKTKKISKEKMEEYLVGVVSTEMPALYEKEALKAQAVAARSYILSKIGTKNPDHEGAEVCTNSAHCKAYVSDDELKERWGEKYDEYLKKIKDAVSQTKGEYIAYDGETAVACFYAVSGGRTESSKDVWGGEKPYLQSVDSPWDLEYDGLIEKVKIDKEKVKSTLGVQTLQRGGITRTSGGSVKTVAIGEKVFSGTEIRQLFGLNSANFEIEEEEEKIIFVTKGKGHGVGMSQFGANQMAKQGKDYKEILTYYYQGVEIKKAEDGYIWDND